MDRRHFLKLGFASSLGVLLHRQSVFAERPKKADSPYKRCMIIWLNGGASQLDTFDPKPMHKNGGGVKTVGTRIKGVKFADSLAGLAERSQYLTIVRSLSSTEGDHRRASHYVKTGARALSNFDVPVLGAIAARQLSQSSLSTLPAFFKIGENQILSGRLNGYLDSSFAPFKIDRPGQSVSELTRPEMLSPEKLARRQKLLTGQDSQFYGPKSNNARARTLRKAYELSRSNARDIFDLSRESEAMRRKFGAHNAGQSLLLGSRLLESGVKCVEASLTGWDTHENNRQRSAQLARELDQAFSSLIDRLRSNSLLQSTLILCISEFGRTPKINGRDGRDHFPAAFSAVIAGGPKRGNVIGETSTSGEQIVKDAVSVPDFFASCIKLLGGNPGEEFMAGDRPVKLSSGKAIKSLLG